MTAIESALDERPEETRSRIAVGREEPVYRQDARDDEPHFFRDLALCSVYHDVRAMDRLRRHQAQSGEKRDIGSAAMGAQVVPQFLVDLAAGPVRGGGLYDALPKLPLPSAGVAFTVPRSVTTAGSVAAAQTSQNTAVAETDISMTNTERSMVTISGQATVTFQTLDRAPSVTSPYIVRDLTEAVKLSINNQLINGTGANGQLLGLRNVTDLATITWTDATPTRSEFVNFTARAASSVSTNRLQNPDLIVMHPRRWFWLMGAVGSDTSGPATLVDDQVCPEYETVAPYVGGMIGLPTVTDATVPTTVSNAVSNEDIVLVIRSQDMPLHLGEMQVVTDRETEAGSLEITFIGYQYAVWFPDRFRGTSTAVLTGTGLATPVF